MLATLGLLVQEQYVFPFFDKVSSKPHSHVSVHFGATSYTLISFRERSDDLTTRYAHASALEKDHSKG
jgi:hypothetical protein